MSSDNKQTYRVDHLPANIAGLLDSVSFLKQRDIQVEYHGEVTDITVDIDQFVAGASMKLFLLEHGVALDEDGSVPGQDDMTCDGGCGCRCNEGEGE